MKKLSFLLFAIIGGILTLKAATPSEAHHALATHLREGLKTAKTPADSIRILYDVFDVIPRSGQPDVAREIYGVAQRSGDLSTMLDISRLVTAAVKGDNAYVKILENVRKLPDSPERRETELFLEMRRLSYSSRNLNEQDRIKKISGLISEIESGTPADKYKKALQLYSVVAYLRNDASGDLLKKYLDRLIDMVNSKQFSLYALDNLIYSEAANIYSDAGDAQKAVEADKKLLEVIADLEKTYKAKGRNYRDYDINKYVVYRRMIRNYSAISTQEVKDYYAKIQEFVNRSPEVAADYAQSPRLHAYYYFAIGDNAQAIPYIKQLLEKEKALAVRKQLLEMLQKSAKAVGDDTTRVWALSEYNAILEELNALNASEKYKELQILYDVKELKEKNSALELENRNKEIESERSIMTFVVAAFVLILITLVCLLFYWARFQSNARRMGKIVSNLRAERNNLCNNRYYDYANQLDPLAQEELAKAMETNDSRNKFHVSTDMTESILNDILYISSIGRPDRQKEVQLVSVDTVLRETEAKAKEEVGKDFKLNIDFPEDNRDMITDRECLVYMLKRILTTADQISKTKHVDLITRIDDKDKSVSFIFTDEGAKFPEQSEEILFQHFLDADRLLSRKDWGLFFCRIVSFLLNCDLRYDQTYKEGTRFIFKVPLNFAENLK